MANIKIGDIIDIAGAVNKAVNKAADSPNVPAVDHTNSTAIKDVINTSMQADVKKDLQPVIDVVSNQEPFYYSVQWWTQMAGYVIVLLGILGYAVPEEVKQQLLTLITTAVGLVIGIAMFYNRYIRSSALLRKLKGDPNSGTDS